MSFARRKRKPLLFIVVQRLWLDTNSGKGINIMMSAKKNRSGSAGTGNWVTGLWRMSSIR